MVVSNGLGEADKEDNIPQGDGETFLKLLHIWNSWESHPLLVWKIIGVNYLHEAF